MEASKMLRLAGNPIYVVPDGPQAVDTFIESFARQRSLIGDESAFYVMNLGDVIEKYRQWEKLLPNVTPFYAVKCNSDPVLMSVLALLGAGFDCASQQEIQQVLEQLETPVDPCRIVYAHPIKQNSYIRYAKEKGVELMVFDCAEELVKIKALYPEARLLVRINPQHQAENTSESGEMVSKFGCSVPEAARLLEVAEKLDLDVVGVSFYAGHRCFVPSVYDDCISMSRSVFDAAAKSCPRFRFNVLDIGGGFYGEWKTARLPFADAASAIKSALERHFGDLMAAENIQVIAEPGAFIAMTSSTLIVNVVGVRRMRSNFHDEVDGGEGHVDDSTTNSNGESRDDNGDASIREKSNEERYNYYVNDGIYGSFKYYEFYSKQRSESNSSPYRLAARQSESSSKGSHTKTYRSTVWGPTCDGLDCVIERCQLERIEVGDWLAFKDMGQYSFAMASGFNGIPPPSGCYVIEQRYVNELGLI